MRKASWLLIAVSLVLVLVATACGGGGSKAASAPKGDVNKGKQLFADTCATCHGPDAKGMAGLGKDLTKSTFVKDLSEAEFLAFLQVGRPASDKLNTTGTDMPPRGGNPSLTDADLQDIMAFVRSINTIK